jgi:hypothetical protein
LSHRTQPKTCTFIIKKYRKSIGYPLTFNEKAIYSPIRGKLSLDSAFSKGVFLNVWVVVEFINK